MGLNAGQRRTHSMATSRGLKRYAEATQCRSCHRKAAMKEKYPDAYTFVLECKWCGHRGTPLVMANPVFTREFFLKKGKP